MELFFFHPSSILFLYSDKKSINSILCNNGSTKEPILPREDTNKKRLFLPYPAFFNSLLEISEIKPTKSATSTLLFQKFTLPFLKETTLFSVKLALQLSHCEIYPNNAHIT